MFPAIVQTENCAHCLLHLIDWPHPHRPPCRAFFVREVNLEAVGVLVLHAGLGEGLVGPFAETRHIPNEHIILALARGDPLCGHKAHATRLTETGDDPVAAEIVFQVGMRTIENARIRRPDHRPVDHPLDPGAADHRHTGNRPHHIVFDPFEIVGEKLVAETLRRAVLGPEFHRLFIGTHEKALALLPQVILAVAVGDRRQAAIHRGDFGDGLGDEILMLGRHQGQLDPRQRRHLAAPEAGGVDHPVGVDIALRRFDNPCAVRLLDRRCHRCEAIDLGPAHPCARGIGIGHARGIDVAAIGLVHDAADAVEIDKRVQALGLVATHLVEIHPVKLGLRGLQPQLMFACFGLGKIERAGLEHAAALPRLGLELFVEAHCIVLNAADVGRVMQPMYVGRRVPRGSRGQLVPLEKNNIGPTQLGQVI